jgi:phenylalanyl-tRNA synthetase alpha chain
MQEKLETLKKEFESQLQKVSDALALDELEQKFFSRKNGVLNEAMKGLKDLSDDVRKEAGQLLNTVKADIENLLFEKKSEFEKEKIGMLGQIERIDVTQPLLTTEESGHLHPNTIIQYQLEDLFASMGFMVWDGPELESDYYNFTALNIPKDHPARDMQDTFYVKGHSDWVMRTQTSSFQVRALQKFGAPLRLIVPGRCFRNESTDPRHEHTFYQMEGLVVGEKITFADMKGVFQSVADHLYGIGTKIRLMPKLYPFVEPGVRGELSCFICEGKGCRVCKNTGWLEAMPGGMVHPNVLREGGIDPEKYQGFAFGFGLNRLAMLKYGIEDIRHFQSGDLRFLQQF